MNGFEHTCPPITLNIFVVYIFMYVQVHTQVCTHVPVCTCACLFKDNLGCSLHTITIFPFLRQGPESTSSLAWLASESHDSGSLCWHYKNMPSHLPFFFSTGVLGLELENPRFFAVRMFCRGFPSPILKILFYVSPCSKCKKCCGSSTGSDFGRKQQKHQRQWPYPSEGFNFLV